MTCRQCNDNFKIDAIEPECDGQGATAACPVAGWDTLTRTMLVLYDRSCPWGELDQLAARQAMDDLQIAPRDRRLARGCLLAIHRLIKQQIQTQRTPDAH